MAVTSVRELFTGRQGGFDGTKSESTRVFRVTTNTPYDDEQSIYSSGMLPFYNSAHPRNTGLFARTFRADQENGAYIWKATVGYDNVASPLPQLATEFQPNPLLRRVKVRGKTVHSREAMTAAPLVYTGTIAAFANGTSGSMTTKESPLQSSSHEPFEGYEKDVDQFVWEVTWNVSTIPFWVTDYNNTMNSAPVQLLGLTLPKWSLKLRGFSHSDLLTEKVGVTSFNYYQVQFELHYRKDLWFRGIADRGFYKLVGGKQQRIELDDGMTPVVPVPLDGAGGAISSPSLVNCVYRWYAPSPEKNFSQLPIPAT
jgi:hypothetical protein